jgi:hypothetical protein
MFISLLGERLNSYILQLMKIWKTSSSRVTSSRATTPCSSVQLLKSSQECTNANFSHRTLQIL